MDILSKIENAGIVGCGGAGFPTHRKLKGQFQYLIANGAECEPLLRTDRYLMREQAPALVQTMDILARELGTGHCVIAVKEHYHQEIAALRAAILEQNAAVELYELGNFYPAGDEQAIVCEVTGRVVPPGGIPAAVGAVVDNIATIYAISQALKDIPFTEKYLTVTGEVNEPVVLKVPVGTSLLRCIQLAGGAKRSEYQVLLGGPMMGKPVPASELEQAVVTKTTSGILVLPPDGYHAQKQSTSVESMLKRAASTCIQCTSCTQLCPRYLTGHPIQPHRIMRKLAGGGPISALLEDPDVRMAQFCCECGVCEVYACPMGLQPRRINGLVKQELGKAGQRVTLPPMDYEPRQMREERKIPPRRLAARLGVGRYFDTEITKLVCETPEQIQLPLKMNIGAPCVPSVTVGQRILTGECVATVPEGALGACIHSGISGIVTSVTDRIVIEKE